MVPRFLSCHLHDWGTMSIGILGLNTQAYLKPEAKQGHWSWPKHDPKHLLVVR